MLVEKKPLLDNMKEFRKILANCVTDAPAEENSKSETFNVVQGLAITDYISRSIFQHYKLYEFVFHTPQSMQIIGTNVSVPSSVAANSALFSIVILIAVFVVMCVRVVYAVYSAHARAPFASLSSVATSAC